MVIPAKAGIQCLKKGKTLDSCFRRNDQRGKNAAGGGKKRRTAGKTAEKCGGRRENAGGRREMGICGGVVFLFTSLYSLRKLRFFVFWAVFGVVILELRGVYFALQRKSEMKNTNSGFRLSGFRLRPLAAVGALFAAGLLAASGLTSGERAPESGGFLYSEYLTGILPADSGGIAGSFVVETDRPLAGFKKKAKGVLQREVSRVSARDALDYLIGDADLATSWRVRTEKAGWEIADIGVNELFLAATEDAKQSGFVRTAELDWKTELGGRRGNVGVNFLGALRETDIDAVAWQLRAFKGRSDRGGGNAGLIYRRVVGETLVGGNLFLDFETHSVEDFWRWSAGGEVRSEWVDLFANYYVGITDDAAVPTSVNSTNYIDYTYTADGFDIEANVHSPEIRWFTAVASYYNFEGKYGDDDDTGFRFGTKLTPPNAPLEIEIYRDTGDEGKSFGGELSWNHRFGETHSSRRAVAGFEPREFFFVPAVREYTQRIRTARVTVESLGNGVLTFRGAGSIDVMRADGVTVSYTAADSPITIPYIEEDNPFSLVTDLEEDGDRVTVNIDMASGARISMDVGSSISFDGSTLTLGYGNVSLGITDDETEAVVLDELAEEPPMSPISVAVVAPGAATISVMSGTSLSVGYGDGETRPQSASDEPVTISVETGMADIELPNGATVRISANRTELSIMSGDNTLSIEVSGGAAALVDEDGEPIVEAEAGVSVAADGVISPVAAVFTFPANKRYDGSVSDGVVINIHPHLQGIVDADANVVEATLDSESFPGWRLRIGYEGDDDEAPLPDITIGSPLTVAAFDPADGLTVANLNRAMLGRGALRGEVREDGTIEFHEKVLITDENIHDLGEQYFRFILEDDTTFAVVEIRVTYYQVGEELCRQKYSRASGTGPHGYDLSENIRSLFGAVEADAGATGFTGWHVWDDEDGAFVPPSRGDGHEPIYDGLPYRSQRQFGARVSDALSAFHLVPGDLVAFDRDGDGTIGSTEDAERYYVYTPNPAGGTGDDDGIRYLAAESADPNDCQLADGEFHLYGGFRGGNRPIHGPYASGLKDPSSRVSFVSWGQHGRFYRNENREQNGGTYIVDVPANQIPSNLMLGVQAGAAFGNSPVVSLAGGDGLILGPRFFRNGAHFGQPVYPVLYDNADTDWTPGTHVMTLEFGSEGLFSPETLDFTMTVTVIVRRDESPTLAGEIVAAGEVPTFIVETGGGQAALYPYNTQDPENGIRQPLNLRGTTINGYRSNYYSLEHSYEIVGSNPNNPLTMRVVDSEGEFPPGPGERSLIFANGQNFDQTVSAIPVMELYFRDPDQITSGLYSIVVRVDESAPYGSGAADTTPDLLLTIQVSMDVDRSLQPAGVPFGRFWSTMPLTLNVDEEYYGGAGHDYYVEGTVQALEVDIDGRAYLTQQPRRFTLQADTEYFVTVRIERSGEENLRRIFSVRTAERESRVRSHTCPILYRRADDTYRGVDLSQELVYILAELFDATRENDGYNRFRLYFERAVNTRGSGPNTVHPHSPGDFLKPAGFNNSLIGLAPETPPNRSGPITRLPVTGDGPDYDGLFGRTISRPHYERANNITEYIDWQWLNKGDVIAITEHDTPKSEVNLSSRYVYRVYSENGKEYLAKGEPPFGFERSRLPLAGPTYSCGNTSRNGANYRNLDLFFISETGDRTETYRFEGGARRHNPFPPNPGVGSGTDFIRR